uniref:DUF659 domain-containing protein n=1 Tax=Latimeria chalumnae TaxID=7897 RepID=H3B220_LATCH
GGTSNLTAHVCHHHPVKLGTASTRASSSSTAVSRQNKEGPLKLLLSGFGGSRYPQSSLKAIPITEKTVRFIAKDLRPFVVEGKEFRGLLHTMNPRYEVLNMKHFSEIVLQKKYHEVKECSSVIIPRVALTTGGWTSRATESYITIISSHTNANWELVNYILQTIMQESQTGENTGQVLKDAISEWAIPQNPPLVTDNASNMDRAGEFARCEPHVKCYAHTVNLAVQRALKVNAVARLLGCICMIVYFFSTEAQQQNGKTQLLHLPEHKLIMDVCTQWSSYDMVQRFLEFQMAVAVALQRHKKKDLNTLTDFDISLAENVADNNLKPLKTITTALRNEQVPTISFIVPLQRQLLDTLLVPKDEDSLAIMKMKHAIREDLSHCYIQHKDLLVCATVLDPRFKKFLFLKETKRYSI